MRPTILLTPLLPWLALVASCSTPPQPPSVDESRKRPANTAMAVDLQVCKSDLQNTRLRAVDSGRVAEAHAVTQTNIAALQRALIDLDAHKLATQTLPNSIVTVRFDYGSTRVDIPSAVALGLIKEAKSAPLILLRGRTDGHSETAAESHVARARAAAMSDYLVAAGVSPSQIRATYQAIGDHVADNRTANGRAHNRRVEIEIEIYRTMPVALAATAPTTDSAL